MENQISTLKNLSRFVIETERCISSVRQILKKPKNKRCVSSVKKLQKIIWKLKISKKEIREGKIKK
jgi:hypothetical protein